MKLNSETRGRGNGGWTRVGEHAVRILLSMLATLAFILPMTFLKTGVPAPATGAHGGSLPLVSLPGAGSREALENPAVRNIYAWAALNDPDFMLTPNETLGYACFAGGIPPYNYYKMPEFVLPLERTAPQGLKGTGPEFDARHVVIPRTLFTLLWTPVISVARPVAPPMLPLKGIIWCGVDGRRVLNPPLVDVAGAREVWKRGRPPRPTVIEALPDGGYAAGEEDSGGAGRIVVRQSSGNSGLDVLAVSALRRRLEHEVLARRFNAALPRLTPVILEVFWKLD